jgi:RimJ/RimL family protein N-acetyltransferase
LNHPFLVGEKVYLRALTEADLTGNYFQWFNDQEVCRYNSHGAYPNSLARMQSYFARTQQDASLLALAIVDKATDVHVGNIALQEINWLSRSAEYAIVLGEKDYWGKGLGMEASTLILEHAFCRLNLFRVYCGTSADNLPMQKLAKHMGMQQEGVRRSAIYKNGFYRDIYEYGILREDYLERRTKSGSNAMHSENVLEPAFNSE